jgi:endonuclease/exonuclease/phosphatase family metal-dependent hydrolase
MRILTWNILHGGGRERSPRILLEILDLRPDVVVITEARRRFAGQLAGAFADAGLCHALGPEAPDGVNGVMILARDPLRPLPCADIPAGLAPRWLEAEIPCRALRICGVHLPEAGRAAAHAAGWRHLLRRARDTRDERQVLAGDLNTWRDGPASRPRNGASATNLGRLAALGYADAWRCASADGPANTWAGCFGEAFRLDYVLVSRPLAPRVERARVLPFQERDKLSDHAALVVDISETP